jgi:bifunctional non-homologous end joining protein LigD
VSTPLAWQELKKVKRAANAALLAFDSEAVLRRVKKFGDLFAPVLTMKQKFPKWETS